MDASIISALAALTGTAVGGSTSVVANWLTQRTQIRAQWLQDEKNRRQILYRDFIEEASKSATSMRFSTTRLIFPVWSASMRSLAGCAFYRPSP